MYETKECGKLQTILDNFGNVDESKLYLKNIKQWYQLLEFVGHHISNLRNKL
jgi:hypothetical protein